jgi:hypothetical protein
MSLNAFPIDSCAFGASFAFELSVTSSMQPAVERVSAVNGIGRYYRATPGSPCDLPERESGYLATG